MSGKLILIALALGALGLAMAGCDDEKGYSTTGDYSACPEGTIVDYSDNQKTVCNDLKKGVEELCGFDLTVDVCVCAAQVGTCIEDTAWLQVILDCRSGAATCVDYMTCLEAAGESPTGCADPTTWECIVSTSDTDGQ